MWLPLRSGFRSQSQWQAKLVLVASSRHPRSTLKIISDLEKEIVALDSENTASSRMLLHVVDELQTTIKEEHKSLIEEKEQRSGMDDANGGPEPMHVD
ncbi:hypothetical protein ACLB2K_019014 [Fragaria x ananassa]